MTKSTAKPEAEPTRPLTLKNGVDETKNYELYESYYTCHFFRLWGRAEFSAGLDIAKMAKDVLLGNMQNFLDEAFGDVAGKINGRYFIIEFKAERAGIQSETKSKEHRKELLNKLDGDVVTRTLADKGHFAGFPDEKNYNSLAFESYFTAAKPEVAGNSITFSQLYEKLTAKEGEGGGSGEGSKFAGWSQAEASDYVKSMYLHLKIGEHKTKHAEPQYKVMLGVVDLDTSVFHGFVENFDTLLAHLYLRIMKAEADATALANPKQTPLTTDAKARPAPAAVDTATGGVSDGSPEPAPDDDGHVEKKKSKGPKI